jgi:hypothetical protein
MHKQPQRQDLTRSLVENGAGPCKKALPIPLANRTSNKTSLAQAKFCTRHNKKSYKRRRGALQKALPFDVWAVGGSGEHGGGQKKETQAKARVRGHAW